MSDDAVRELFSEDPKLRTSELLEILHGLGRVIVDVDRVKGYLVGLSLADHMGDINDYLPDLCAALKLPAPTWSDRCGRLVMAWEGNDDD